jgi:nitric oxide reductase subunit C
MPRLFIFCILFLVFAVYTSFVYTTGTSATNVVMNEQALQGKELFQKYNCGACHQIYGLGGYLGPELTDIVSKPGKSPAYLKAMMNAGVLPMPSYNLKDEQADQLLAYLIYINQTVPDYKK